MTPKTGNNKTKTTAWQSFGELPPHAAPPKPMTEQELEGPAPTPAELKDRLRKVLSHVCTPERLQHLVFRLYDCARHGDKWAAQMLFDMIRGAKEPDSPTVEQSDVKPLSRKQVEEELAKLGYSKTPGLNVKPHPGTPVDPA